jgi:ABC-type amino acid transport system permease subunit
MSAIRDEKAASRLLELAARYIALEAGRETLITPMRVDISPDRKNATVYVSIFTDTPCLHLTMFYLIILLLFFIYWGSHLSIASNFFWD